MTVSNSWLVNVPVNINTTTLSQAAFNKAMLVGVMPTQSTPYQCPPTSWGGNIYNNYTSLTDFSADFAPLIAGALAQGDLYQLARFYWLSNSVTAFFEQSPTPSSLFVSAIPPNSAATYSTCVVQIVTNAAVTIPAGTVVTPETATSSYVLLQPYVAASAGTYSVTFYSIDVTTAISASTFTAISPTLSAVTGVSNSGTATLGIVGTPTNYVTLLQSIVTAQNEFYGLEICDLMLAGGTSGYSSCVVKITTSAAATLPAGLTVTPQTATSSYTLLQSWRLPSAGTYLVPFFSADGTTQIDVNTFTASVPVLSGVTIAGNLASIPSIPGFTSPNGLVAALAAQRTATNQKIAFQDTLDYTVAGAIQTAGGSKDLAIFFHSLNLQAPTGYIPSTIATVAEISGAALGEYFTDLFSLGVGSKPISSMQLANQPIDTFITTSNIGTPGQAGSSTNLIGYTNNVYAGIGAPPGIGLLQYGYVTATNFAGEVTTQIYVDEVVGSTYLQFVAQSDLVAFIISKQPTGGIYYSDFGIQEILNIFKGSVQKAVNQNIIQSPPNSAYDYTNYANVDQADIAAKIYRDLTFNGNFLSRIQRISVSVNLKL